ncbi:nitroreductase family protein [Devosia insulae]|nr:nitroreductase family protein [Devosia insulae]
MDTIAAIYGRRSIRDYEPRLVPRPVVAAILHDAAQAPTPPPSGAAPFVFVVIEGIERIAAYGDAALAFARAHRKPDRANDWVDKPGFLVFFNAPAVVIICGFDDGYGQALQDCNRAGQNLMLSAHARGLGTCWVGSPMLWLRDPATRAKLGIPANYTPHAALTLGYPSGTPSGIPRQEPEIIWQA